MINNHMKTFPYKTTIATYCEKNTKFKSNSIFVTKKAKYKIFD